MGPLRLLRELWPLFGSSDSRIVVVQTLRHPLADDVHQPLEGLLHVNVVFSTHFKVLKTCQEGLIYGYKFQWDSVEPFITSGRITRNIQLKSDSYFSKYQTCV